jgi:tetratricopeptide (TPR) repeat protein
MYDLRKPIRQAQRRMTLNTWLSSLGWCFAGAAALFILGILIQRVSLTGEYLPPFLSWFSLAAAAAALTASAVWTWLRRPSFQVAAAQLDVAAGLKERLSTGLYCQSSQDPLHDDPFHRAVLADAARISAGITPSRHMPVRMPLSANFAGPSLLLALVLFLVFPTLDLSGNQKPSLDELQRNEAVTRMQNAVQAKIEQQIQTIREKNPALEDDIKELDPMKPTGAETPLDVRRDALKQVEKLSQKLEEKKSSEEIAEMQEMKTLLRRIAQRENAAETPVGKLAQSLSEGDFKEAKKTLDEIQLKLNKAPTTEEEKRKADELRKQLEQLAQQIQKAADSDQKNKDALAKTGMNQEEIQRALENLQKKDFESLKKQLEEKGLDQQKIQKMMQQMQNRCNACDGAKQLGQKLAQGAQGAGQGQGEKQGQQQAGGSQMSGGQQGLSQAGEQLSEMEALQQQLNELDSAMADLDSMKNDLGQSCSQCNGTGMVNGRPCGACQGTGMGRGQGQPGNSGMGQLGQGQGGVAPEQVTDFDLKKERTSVISKAGQIIHQEYVDGEQFKGDASPELKGASLSAERFATETIERGDVPGVYHESIGKYFNRNVESTATADTESTTGAN